MIPQLSKTIGQLNLYAYCNNNPIKFIDGNGEGILASLLIGFIVTCLAAVDGGISAVISGGNFWLGVLAGAFGGIVASLLLSISSNLA